RPVAAALEQADGDEALDRLSHRRPGDAEVVAQRALRREWRPRWQCSGADRLVEAVADLLGDGAAVDRPEVAGEDGHPCLGALISASARSSSSSRSGRMIAWLSSSPQRS